MKEWFESLEVRERRLVIGGAVTLFVLSIYFLGWEPFINRLHDLQESTQRKQLDLAWMQNAAKEVKKLQATQTAPVRFDSGQSLLGIIDRSAKAKQLGDSVKRVQPDGTSKARVWLENAKFDVVIGWLEELERRYGVSIETITFEKQAEEGLVDARISFFAEPEA
ncbi:MAG: type II secretion system protein M [Gammaproteobacteria bacterium]|jgi:general secretion pathway protein M